MVRKNGAFVGSLVYTGGEYEVTFCYMAALECCLSECATIIFDICTTEQGSKLTFLPTRKILQVPLRPIR